MKELEEYVMDDLKTSELVFYRDVKNTGRIFANKSVFDRFHIPTPRFVIEMDNGERIYELSTDHAVDIINGANNLYSPYIVQYRYIELNENEELYRNNPETKEEVPVAKTFIFYRNINDPEKMYVRKEVFDRFHIVPTTQPVFINGVPCFEISREDVLYITSNSRNTYSPYVVKEKGIPLDRREEPKKKSINDLPYKEKFIIYRNIDHPTTLYVRKEIFKRFHLNTDVEEVIISGIPCYVIDRGDLNYIIGNANNSYSPYEIEYKDVKVKSANIRAAYNPDAIEEFKIFRNSNNPDKWYVDKRVFDRFHLNVDVESVVISGVPCYAIDEEDLAYIVGNANNKYAPYKVRFVDVPIDSSNMKPGYNTEATQSITVYRNIGTSNMSLVRKDVFERFHLQTEVEEVRINGDTYYVIDPSDLEYIIRNANNKYSPYKVVFKDVPLGILRRKNHEDEDESARDLVKSAFIPGTDIEKPRNRRYDETNEEYIAYLEDFYKEVFGIKQRTK